MNGDGAGRKSDGGTEGFVAPSLWTHDHAQRGDGANQRQEQEAEKKKKPPLEFVHGQILCLFNVCPEPPVPIINISPDAPVGPRHNPGFARQISGLLPMDHG